jgi:hypothetical protein
MSPHDLFAQRNGKVVPRLRSHELSAMFLSSNQSAFPQSLTPFSQRFAEDVKRETGSNDSDPLRHEGDRISQITASSCKATRQHRHRLRRGVHRNQFTTPSGPKTISRSGRDLTTHCPFSPRLSERRCNNGRWPARHQWVGRISRSKRLENNLRACDQVRGRELPRVDFPSLFSMRNLDSVFTVRRRFPTTIVQASAARISRRGYVNHDLAGALMGSSDKSQTYSDADWRRSGKKCLP